MINGRQMQNERFVARKMNCVQVVPGAISNYAKCMLVNPLSPSRTISLSVGPIWALGFGHGRD